MPLQASSSGYRDAFKSTAIFGGAQIVTIGIKVLLSKIIALWVGTYGMGLVGLYNTSIGLISNVTNLGLQSSAVRDIAGANGDVWELSKRIKALERWVFVSGCVGSLLVIILSPLLSQLYFGNTDYMIPFMCLSVVVLFNGLSQQKNAILQGTRKIRILVKSIIFSGLSTFVISIPIYYFFREEGIVGAMVLSSVISYFVNIHYARSVRLYKIEQSYKESFYLGLSAVKLGLAMSVSSILSFLVEFIVRAYISREGGINDVGLYAAGCAINTQYLGLVFTAMAKDYYPRLSQNSSNNKLIADLMNKQAEIALLILAPLIAVMLVGIDFFVSLLYSSDFLTISPMVKYLLLGSFIKAGAWGLSFIFLAKNDAKGFVMIEVLANMTLLPIYVIGYTKYNLEGIGYGFMLQYTIYFIIVAVVCYHKFRIHYTWRFFRLFVVIAAFLIALLMVADFLILGVVITGIICVVCLSGLNKRLGLFVR